MSRIRHHRLLLAITVAAILLLIAVGLLSSSPGTQLRVIREIRRVGGIVHVNPPRRAGWFGPVGVALPDAFGEVYSVSIADVPLRKQWLVAMRDWPQLSTVWLNRASVEDADLRRLAGHPRIVELYLNGNPITDLGLTNLGTLPSLHRLELNWTRIKRLPNLSLQFPRLRTLKLRGTSLPNAEFTRLADSRTIESLDVTRTPVSDTNLKAFARMPQLHLIELQGTPTTYEAAFQLQAALPNSFVYSRDGTAILPVALRH